MQNILITGSTRGIGKGLAPLGEVLGVACDVRQLASLQAAWVAGVARTTLTVR